MEELFMKYPIAATLIYEGIEYFIMGYELYDDKRYLLLRQGDKECRFDVERLP